jgi:hypothetical protein
MSWIPARSGFSLATFIVLSALSFAACGGTVESGETPFEGFDGCEAGAGSAIVFLQRTLEELGDAELDEARDVVPDFDDNVEAMALRAREVHCTEDGFNQAIIDRADELTGQGPAARMLIASVEMHGLGSLDADRGSLITLPGG